MVGQLHIAGALPPKTTGGLGAPEPMWIIWRRNNAYTAPIGIEPRFLGCPSHKSY